jgi:sugar lactone lactonase YvrE
MGTWKSLGLLPLALGWLACGSSNSPAPAPAPMRNGSGGPGGMAAAPKPGGATAADPSPTVPATDVSPPVASDAGSAPVDTGTNPPSDTHAMPETAAAPDAPPPSAPPPGEFPLAALKAAKAELYVKANAHVEGPTWRNGEVLFAADGAGWGMMRIDVDRKLYRYHPTLRPVGSHLLGSGSVLFGDHVHSVVQVFPDGKVATLAVDFDGKPIEFANDLTLDAAGNFYTSGRRGGFIYRVSPAGEVVRVASGINLPNGVEVDPASTFLYFGTAKTIMRIALPASGSDFGKPEMVAAAGQPDGMAFDAWGNLWIADWGAGHIVVLSAEGKTVTTVGTGGRPINLTFGGKDLDTVYVATDFKGIYKIGPVPGLRGFHHPGAASYAIKKMLEIAPANTPRN